MEGANPCPCSQHMQSPTILLQEQTSELCQIDFHGLMPKFSNDRGYKPILGSSKVVPQNRWCRGHECHSPAAVPQVGLTEPAAVHVFWFFAVVVGSVCIFFHRSCVQG